MPPPRRRLGLAPRTVSVGVLLGGPLRGTRAPRVCRHDRPKAGPRRPDWPRLAPASAVASRGVHPRPRSSGHRFLGARDHDVPRRGFQTSGIRVGGRLPRRPWWDAACRCQGRSSSPLRDFGGPPGFLCRSTRDGSYEEGRRLCSAYSEPSPLSRPGSSTRAKHTVSAHR
jgi:hypothetical protein